MVSISLPHPPLLGGVAGFINMIRQHLWKSSRLRYTTDIPDVKALNSLLASRFTVLQHLANRGFVDAFCEAMASFTHDVLMVHFEDSHDPQVAAGFAFDIVTRILQELNVQWINPASSRTRFILLASTPGYLVDLKDLIKDSTH